MVRHAMCSTAQVQQVPSPDGQSASSRLRFTADTSLTWDDNGHLTVRCLSCLSRQFTRRDESWQDVSLRYVGREADSSPRAR